MLTIAILMTCLVGALLVALILYMFSAALFAPLSLDLGEIVCSVVAALVLAFAVVGTWLLYAHIPV